MGRADEVAVVRRSFDLEHGVVDLATGACQCLLKLRLVVDVTRAGVLDRLRERLDDRRLDAFEAMLEVERGDRSLENRSQDVAAAGDALELVGGDIPGVVQETVPELELLGHHGTCLARDNVGADLRQAALRGVAETLEDGMRDRELEDTVPEKLEALVRLGSVVGPGRVREDLVESGLRKLGDQAAELAWAFSSVPRTSTPGAR